MHGDMFGLDGCTFSNALSNEEKQQQLKDNLQAIQAQSDQADGKKLNKKVKTLNTAQKDAIMGRVKQLLSLRDGKNVECLMCAPVGDTTCQDAAKTYLDKKSYEALQEWFKKHTKY